MNRKDAFKILRAPTLAASLSKRCEKAIAERQEKQRACFWEKRSQEESPIEKETTVVAKKHNTRAEMLKKWKEEKLKKLEEAKRNKKPVFKVGIVHRKATGSPVLESNSVSWMKKNKTEKPKPDLLKKHGMVTRSQVKNVSVSTRNTLKLENQFKKSPNNFCKIQNAKKKVIAKHEFKVPESVVELQNKIKNFTFNNIESEKSTKKVQINEVESKKGFVSPIVKDNLRGSRSGRVKKSIRNRDAELETQKARLEEKITPFRHYIESETRRLLEKAEKWKCIYEDFEEISTEIEGDIDSVIGKTKLLTSSKFMQFKNLIDKCANGDPLIKIDDLQGFQDWVSIEVNRIDEDFDRLEEKKLNNWMSESAPAFKTKKVAVKKTTKRLVGKSNIKAHIEAARKCMQKENMHLKNDEETPNRLMKETITKKHTPRKNILKDISNSAKKFMPSTPNNTSLIVKEMSGEYSTKVTYSPILTPKHQIYIEKRDQNLRKKTPLIHCCNSSKKKSNALSRRGLDEKYFRPVEDDEGSLYDIVSGNQMCFKDDL